VPAAEQPKLTPSVWTITEEAAKHSHFCYHKDSDEWKCSCGETLSKYVIPYDERRKLNSLDSEMGFVRFNHKDHFRFALNHLLAAPVAPPPQILQTTTGVNLSIERYNELVQCEQDKRHLAHALENVYSIPGVRRLAIDVIAPLAPGEQMPMPNDECWKCGLRRETHPIPTCKEFVAPPAQEREAQPPQLNIRTFIRKFLGQAQGDELIAQFEREMK